MKSAGLEFSGPAFLLNRKAGIGILVLVLALLLFLPVIPALCVEDAETGETKAIFTPPQGTEFYVEFTHSVNRTAVREYYMIRSGKIILVRAEYSSFGAGMPEVPEASGSTLSMEEGVLKLDHIDTIMPDFIYRVGTVAEHTLHMNERVVPLKSIAPPQTALRFQYRNVSAYAFLRRLDPSE